MAPTKGAVRDYQRRMAQLGAAYAKAHARLETARAKRAAVLAKQDGLVAAAEDAVHRSVMDLAVTFGPGMAADVVGLEPGEVRRIIREGGRG
jgi:hypothetical protein